ncbi:glycosyltransferase family 2 protein [Aurantibacter sp.]|uniref:glycosyltransferase family 2 protein n=1 Tax=Aurantibacter sp. TaxID=2807103 RepID=UPI0035C81DB8
MQSKEPLVSIIIPCYNQAQFLEETLNSVLAQSYKNWECLIVNDGSTDNSLEICNIFKSKDHRFLLFDIENKGRSNARNIGLDQAKGDWIQFLDSDDVLHKDKILNSLALQKKKSGMIITDFLRFRKTINKPRRAFCDLSKVDFNYENILLQWELKFSIPIHCGLFKKSILNSIRFNTDLNANEDWCFWLEFYKNEFSTEYVNQKLVFYRMNPNGTVVNFDHMEENTKLAKLHIFNNLEDQYKSMFFNRVIKELSKTKHDFKFYKDNIFYRKVFYKIKRLLS